MPHYWVDDPDDDFDYDMLNLDEPDETVPFEEYVQQFRDKFGYEPKIKNRNAFTMSALTNFEMLLDEAIEIEHERK